MTIYNIVLIILKYIFRLPTQLIGISRIYSKYILFRLWLIWNILHSFIGKQDIYLINLRKSTSTIG